MTFLGHIIDVEGVHPDPEKVKAIVDWEPPKTIKKLRGFLGLTRYYGRFIRNYAQIAAPMTDLLKKNCFKWGELAATSFVKLKEAMVTAPVLGFPDFSKQFTIETDACKSGVGAVLSQDTHPISFFSRKISEKSVQHQFMSKKCMLSLLQ